MSAPPATPCITVDVEDFHDGMAVLGHPVGGQPGIRLASLRSALERASADGARVTLFVVGKFAQQCRADLSELAQAGHEIASHGPDHGHLPTERAALERWLRTGREMLEQAVGQPVVGFRPPRFDLPAGVGLAEYRELIARAGFTYVSDRVAGTAGGHGVVELPVSRLGRLPIGGGSYQRMLPRAAVVRLLARCPAPAVFYYHSYDFGTDALPPLRSSRSAPEVRQLLLRRRVQPVFTDVLRRFGSVPCREVASELRSLL